MATARTVYFTPTEMVITKFIDVYNVFTRTAWDRNNYDHGYYDILLCFYAGPTAYQQWLDALCLLGVNK